MALVETKINGDRAHEQSLKFGFSENCRVETKGRVGGIWLFWQKDAVRVEVVTMLKLLNGMKTVVLHSYLCKP